jgi:hypothetical protein
MKSLTTLETILRLHHRGAGNTTAAIMTARIAGAVFIVAHRQHAALIQQDKEGRKLRLVLSLGELEAFPERALGIRAPIVIDHFALESLLSQIAGDIANLQTRCQMEVESTKTETAKAYIKLVHQQAATICKLKNQIKRLKKRGGSR